MPSKRSVLSPAERGRIRTIRDLLDVLEQLGTTQTADLILHHATELAKLVDECEAKRIDERQRASERALTSEIHNLMFPKEDSA